MPLEKGKGTKTVNRNIATLRREGKSPSQAVAIAMKKAGRSKTGSKAHKK